MSSATQAVSRSRQTMLSTGVGEKTQSAKLYRYFINHEGVATTRGLSTTLGLGVNGKNMGSYLSEFRRVYGAVVEYDRDTKRYYLRNMNEIHVPSHGVRGLHLRIARLKKESSKIRRLTSNRSIRVNAAQLRALDQATQIIDNIKRRSARVGEGASA